MPPIISTSSFQSRVYKMDNVLYEIRDQKGIPKSSNFDPWKLETIKELCASGFVEEKEGFLILTEEGREVIRHDSLLTYDPKNKIAKPVNTEEFVLEIDELNVFSNPFFFAGLILVFAMVLGLTGML